MSKIIIKNTKDKEEYIKIQKNSTNTITMYSYIYTNDKTNQSISKSLANKYSFIEYLKGRNIPKKYISQVEMYEE